MRHLFACFVLLIGCNGSKKSEVTTTGSGSASAAPDAAPAPGSGDGSASATAEVKRPKEVAELEATLVALINEPESDERSKKTCDQFMKIHDQAQAAGNVHPAGVDPSAWDQQITKIVSNLREGLAVTCHDDPPDDSVELSIVYREFQALLAMLPK